MKGMQVIHPNACGIDVGSKFHMVAIGLAEEEIRKFGVYTKDHTQVIEWLKANKVKLLSSVNNYLPAFPY